MCGIVGYTGALPAGPMLLDGLRRLEYRGYDSAGVAVLSPEGGLCVRKTKGRLSALSELTDGGRALSGTTGIGHTRWATHGEPNDANSHPHVSENGRVAVVHNGIIENYAEIKQFLQQKGVHFSSDTDTEVVAQLLEYYISGGADVISAVYKVLHRIEGAYALGILCSGEPGRFIAARRDAPLILGYGDGCNFIASDVTAIIKHTREISYMDDGEVAIVTPDCIEVCDALRRRVEKPRRTVDWDVSAAEKGGYEHFMFKEIMEQPEALRRTILPRIKNDRVVFEDLKIGEEYIKSLKKIYIVACGSSYHVGMIAKYNLERLTRLPVEIALSSEFRYSAPLVDEQTLVIVISQSGETLDSMAALREAKSRGGRILSIVNVVGSSIARESDDVLYTHAGPEIAVATTKAYSTQLAVLNLLALRLAETLGKIGPPEYAEFVAALRALPDKAGQILTDTERIKYLASRCFNHESVFYIGRNLDYALGLEGSLKLKEISYIHSEAYAAGELKHGTISLIEPGTLVVALATWLPLFDKAMSNIVEVISRGATVVALTTESRAADMAKTARSVLTVPDTHPLLQPQLGIIPLQLFAYYIALQRGCDIDKPRNLAKSVTVE
ncbi:MAG: glutamine--fructose-6-phosphate transaminase (isomerizing) [Butyricicoccus sp.]|nr:glutamine--fructose-6-phosphate transaminase (isomerizing) [Butyricicoccus sp.]